MIEIIKPVEKSLQDAIILEIAKRFPYSIDDVRITYEALQSFDDTIKACEYAASLGMNSPLYIVNAVRRRRQGWTYPK